MAAVDRIHVNPRVIKSSKVGVLGFDNSIPSTHRHGSLTRVTKPGSIGILPTGEVIIIKPICTTAHKLWVPERNLHITGLQLNRLVVRSYSESSNGLVNFLPVVKIRNFDWLWWKFETSIDLLKSCCNALDFDRFLEKCRLRVKHNLWDTGVAC